jgi:4,5-DOPA dioxygenase extradiol
MNQEVDHPTISACAGTGARMPALFVGHGSPTNAIEENEFSRAWQEMARALPSRPKAIVCVSAHWETTGTLVTAMERPKTIHDFRGFAPELFELQYPAPRSPQLAQLIKQTVSATDIQLDSFWGLDHGAWSVLHRMFPKADIPVVQLSLDRTKGPEFHYRLGKELQTLRDQGVLIVGSGNIVHNLGRVVWQDTAYDWAVEFDALIKQLILSGYHEAIVDYRALGQGAKLSIPTNEHFLPLLYILALQDTEDNIKFFAEKVTLGSMSMRSMLIG